LLEAVVVLVVRAETSVELAESAVAEMVDVFQKQAHQELTAALSKAQVVAEVAVLAVRAGLSFATENPK
jgi:hypothetical protein